MICAHAYQSEVKSGDVQRNTYIAHMFALQSLDGPALCMRQKPGAHSLAALQVVCGTMGLPTATVRMRGPDGIARTSTGMGTGPVDAAMKAIDSQVRVQVTHFNANCTTGRPCNESMQSLHPSSFGAAAVKNCGHRLTDRLACFGRL